MSHAAPLKLHQDVIVPEWIDYNGHMNLAYYVLIFDHATDKFLDYLGMTQAFRRENHASTFAAEIHVSYLQEVVQGDEVFVTTQLLGYDSKRVHFFHEMYHAEQGYLAATNELISLYMDMQARKVAVMPDSILATLKDIEQSHSELARPPQQGSVISVKRQ